MNRRILFLSVLGTLLTCGSAFAQIPAEVPVNGLVGWWPFNGNAFDESGNSNNGTVFGSTLTSDRNGNPNSAYSFDGIDDYIYVSDDASIQNVATVNFWVKTTSTALMQPLKKSDYANAGGEQYSFALNASPSDKVIFSGKFGSNCNLGGWQSVPSDSDLTDGSWRMITGVITTSTLSLYVDGVLASTVFYPNAGVDQCTGALEFGRNWVSDPRWYAGEMDDIGIWNRALTNCEIQQLHDGPLTPVTTVTATGNTLTADQTGTAYQWLNCNSAYSQIVGATTQSFNPTTNGSYAVVITSTLGFCGYTDTSSCTAMNSVTLIDIPAYVPVSGLVGYWPFNGNADDESGNLNHGTPSGCVYSTDRAGNSNSACSFDGINDYVTVGHSSSISKNIGTVNFWVYTSSPALMQTVKKSNYSNSSGEQYGFALNASPVNNVDFSAKYNSNCNIGTGWVSTSTSTSVSNGNWNMVTGLITSDSIKLYINGVRVAAFAVPNPQVDSCSGVLEFGRNWSLDRRQFDGSLDDIGIWNRVLTDCEIEQMYNSQSTDYSVNISGATLTANQSGASYQWIDCNNNNAPVNGATSQSFLPSSNGNYAVVVTTPGGCSDTSACQQVTSVGMNEFDAEGLHAFPNPATELLNITTDQPVNLAIFDAQGALQSAHFARGTLAIDISGLSEGVYFIRTEDGRVIKFVKTL